MLDAVAEIGHAHILASLHTTSMEGDHVTSAENKVLRETNESNGKEVLVKRTLGEIPVS